MEDLKQDTLALQLGVSQASVSQWERGVGEPPDWVKSKLRARFVMSPTDRTLRSLRMSVLHSPNLCGLLSYRNSEIWLDEQSDAGFDLFPLLTRDDLGGPLRGKLGEEVDEIYEALVRSGIFSGDVAAAISTSTAERDGIRVRGVSTFTPFRVEGDTWLLRAEVRLLGMEDSPSDRPDEPPSLIIESY